MTRYGLTEAVKAIMQGVLGHPFLPSPPELRIQCDKAMEWPARERERIIRREQIERERLPPKPNLTPEQQARRQAIMDRFNRANGIDPEGEERSFIADMEAKYGKEALDAVPDNPRRFAVPGFSKSA